MSRTCACRFEAFRATTAASAATSPRSYGCGGSLARPAAAAGTLRTAARGVCGLLHLGHTRFGAGCAGSAAAALQCRYSMHAVTREYHHTAHVCSVGASAEAGAPAATADAQPQTVQADAKLAGSSISATAAGTIPSAGQPPSGVMKTSAVDYTTLLACCQEVEVPARIDQVDLVPPSSSRTLLQLLPCQPFWSLSSCLSNIRLCRKDIVFSCYALVPQRTAKVLCCTLLPLVRQPSLHRHGTRVTLLLGRQPGSHQTVTPSLLVA